MAITSRILSVLRGTRQQQKDLAGAGLRLHGTLLALKDGIFRSFLTGSLESCTTLTLGEESVVEGTVLAADLRIAGSVQGPVTSRGPLTLLPGARVQGTLTAGSLDLQSGAMATGTLHIGQPPVIDAPAARPLRPKK